MDYGKVSIVMPAYNAQHVIDRSVSSITSQTYENWELLIIDDCSSDATYAIASEIAVSDDRIKVIRLDINQGAGGARNEGIRRSSGKFIAFLDCDDEWIPRKLEIQLEFMSNTRSRFSYSSYFVKKSNGSMALRYAPSTSSISDVLKKCRIGCLTVIYERDLAPDLLMPLIRSRQDMCHWINLLRITGVANGLLDPLAIYNETLGSISSNKLIAARYQWEAYRSVIGLGRMKSLYYFTHYFFANIREKMSEKLVQAKVRFV